jgi:hypothetical protein
MSLTERAPSQRHPFVVAADKIMFTADPQVAWDHFTERMVLHFAGVGVGCTPLLFLARGRKPRGRGMYRRIGRAIQLGELLFGISIKKASRCTRTVAPCTMRTI